MSRMDQGNRVCSKCGSKTTNTDKKGNEQWYKKGTLCFSCYQKDQGNELRIILINHYSNGTNKCECCPENIIELLTLNHLNNDGYIHRKIIGQSRQLRKWIIDNNFPPIFNVLCHNCNWAEGRYGICPHKKQNKEINK